MKIYSAAKALTQGIGLLEPVAVKDISLDETLQDMDVGNRYRSALLLIRSRDMPVGQIVVPVWNGRVLKQDIHRMIVERLGHSINRHFIRSRLTRPLSGGGIDIDELFAHEPDRATTDWNPLVSIVVCTRDRADSLATCLDALVAQHYRNTEMLVVDNAPASHSTEQLIRERYPQVGYVVEPRPGLSFARNQALECVKGELVAFTDDDAVADPGWVSGLVQGFSRQEGVAVVTGLTVPSELENETQVILETNWTFNRGFQRLWHRRHSTTKAERIEHLRAYDFGAGANMGFRTERLRELGGFDPDLGAGTALGGGEDMDIFYRALESGLVILYEPNAVVRHRHRRDRERLKQQISNWGAGFSGFLIKALIDNPRRRRDTLRYLVWDLWGQTRSLVQCICFPSQTPRDLALAQYSSTFSGALKYVKVRRGMPGSENSRPRLRNSSGSEAPSASTTMPIAVRTIDLARPIPAITNVTDFESTTILVTIGTRLVGEVLIRNAKMPICEDEIRDAIAAQLTWELFDGYNRSKRWVIEHRFNSALERRYAVSPDSARSGDSYMSRPNVSVVIATRDRPIDLHRCLEGLAKQSSDREFEIIVVDNNPGSGMTPPVVQGFPGIRLTNESVPGASRARNRGFIAARGEVILTIDDDVVTPEGWLKTMADHFRRTDVAMVTGLILPLQLDTAAQIQFERGGGLGNGFEKREFGVDSFLSDRSHPFPAWKIGAGANMAFRKSLLFDADIGFQEEALGPGTPTEAGEDLYFLYTVASEGYTMIYDPAAYVLHRHRRTNPELRRQMYGYGKGHVAYQLLTLLDHGDLRAVKYLLWTMPLEFVSRLLFGNVYSRDVSAVMLLGMIVAPFSLWRSLRRRRRLGTVTAEYPEAGSFDKGALSGRLV